MTGPLTRTSAPVAALRLVLLFHAGGPWTEERRIDWADCIRTIELATGTTIVAPGASSRVLCDAIRPVLALLEPQP